MLAATRKEELQEQKQHNEMPTPHLNAAGWNRRLGGPRTAKCSPIFKLALPSSPIQLGRRSNSNNSNKSNNSTKVNLIQRPVQEQITHVPRIIKQAVVVLKVVQRIRHEAESDTNDS